MRQVIKLRTGLLVTQTDRQTEGKSENLEDKSEKIGILSWYVFFTWCLHLSEPYELKYFLQYFKVTVTT